MDSEPYSRMISYVTPMSRAEIQEIQQRTKERSEERERKEKVRRTQWMQRQKVQYKQDLAKFLETPASIGRTEYELDRLTLWPRDYLYNRDFPTEFLQEIRSLFPDCKVDYVQFIETYENTTYKLIAYDKILELPFSSKVLFEGKGIRLRIQWE